MPLNADGVRKLLVDDDTHGFTVLSILVAKFGPECINDDPLELSLKAKEEWQVEMDESALNRLSAIVTAAVTLEFYQDPMVFDATCQTLATGETGLLDSVFEPVSFLEMMWGIFEVELVEGEQLFGPRVEAYIESRLSSVVESVEDSGDGEDDFQTMRLEWETMRETLAAQLREVGFEDEVDALFEVMPWFMRSKEQAGETD